MTTQDTNLRFTCDFLCSMCDLNYSQIGNKTPQPALFSWIIHSKHFSDVMDTGKYQTAVSCLSEMDFSCSLHVPTSCHYL